MEVKQQKILARCKISISIQRCCEHLFIKVQMMNHEYCRMITGWRQVLNELVDTKQTRERSVKKL